MPASGTPAVDLVVRAGIAHRVHAYATDRHVASGAPRPGYGLEAAAALGVDPARMFKTLVATVDGRLVAAVVPVDRQLDPKRLAAAVGGRSAALAETGDAERASGSVIGGISPLAMRRPLPLVVDTSAMRQPTVFVSAGRRGLQLELAPDDLVRLGNGILAVIAR